VCFPNSPVLQNVLQNTPIFDEDRDTLAGASALRTLTIPTMDDMGPPSVAVQNPRRTSGGFAGIAPTPTPVSMREF
jgi:hypothetical protein